MNEALSLASRRRMKSDNDQGMMVREVLFILTRQVWLNCLVLRNSILKYICQIVFGASSVETLGRYLMLIPSHGWESLFVSLPHDDPNVAAPGFASTQPSARSSTSGLPP